MEDNLQATKVLTPLADEALSASAKGIPYVCVSIRLCVRGECVRVCCCSSTLLQRLAVALVMTPWSLPCARLL